MKVALFSSYVPFLNSGARHIVEWLEVMLVKEGHQVERVYLPEVDAPDLLFQQMTAFRSVDLSAADRVICFRPQAHLISHPHKILWFIHHLRSFYDLWENDQYRGFPDNAKHQALRDALHAADTSAIREARHVFTNSKVVSDRLTQFNGVSSEVLYPPLLDPERFYCRDFNDEIVCICRLEHHKRQHLLIEALQYTKTSVRLRLCGLSSGPSYPELIRSLIDKLHLAGRVTLDERWISEQEKADYLADCLAAAYLPKDEDSYGYPSLEASHASKPIITTVDAGGVLELVQDGVNGYVTETTPLGLAKAMDQLYTDKNLAKLMGRNALNRLDEMNISWPHVLTRILA